MRIICFNANGIRSANAKGFFAWLARQKADFVCIQELKAQPEQLSDTVFHPKAFRCHYHGALKKGYSGVGLLCRHKPRKVIAGFGSREFDSEGRYIEAQFKNLSVISLYAPSGSSSDERQQAKFRFLDEFKSHLLALKRRKRHYIICGDWNIAHKETDLKNWRGNRKNSGFLPEERAWLDWLFDEAGYNDAFREVCPGPDQYTWWSNRGQARAKNVGWRIDYHVTSPALRGCADKARIYKERFFSDHAPLIIDYKLPPAISVTSAT